MKKTSLNEHINRIKYLTNYNGTRKATINENIDPNQEAAFEKEMQAALSQVLQDLPSELAQVAQTTGNRDGQLDIAGSPTQQQPQQTQPTQQPVQPQTSVQENELNEAIVGLIGGTALALPAITNLIGKAASFLGKKVDSTTLQEFGTNAKNFAEKMHHTYEGLIDKILLPLTKNLDPAKRKMINKLVFYGIIATFFGIGASGAVHAGTAGHLGTAAAEGGLSGIKASELVAAAKEIIPKIMAQVGVS